MQTSSGNRSSKQNGEGEMKGINYIFMGLWIILCFLTFSVCYGSSDFDECIKRAKEYCEAKKWDEAIDQYTKAISIRPKDAYLYYARGVAQYGSTLIKPFDAPSSELKPLIERAISDFNKAIQLKPKNAVFYFLRAKMREKMISLMENAIILNQDLPNIDILQQVNKALEDLTKAISLRPDLFFLFYDRGEMFMRLKLYEKAASDFRRCIELKPSVKSFLNSIYSDYLPTDQAGGFILMSLIPSNVFPLRSDDPDDKAWLAESFIKQGMCYSLMEQKFQAVAVLQRACDLERSYWEDKYEEVWRVSYCRKAAEIQSDMSRDKRWVFLAKMKDSKVFYDSESVKKLPDGHVMIWTAEESLTKWYGPEYKVTNKLYLWKLNCDQMSAAIIKYMEYNADSTEPVKSLDFKFAEMKPVIPRTIGEGIYNVVCQEQRPKK